MKPKRIQMKIFLAMLLSTALPLSITSGIILFQVSQTIKDDRDFARIRVEEDLKDRIDEYARNLNETAYQIYSNPGLIRSIALNEPFLTDSRTYDTVKDIREFFLTVYNQSRLTDIIGMYILRNDGEELGSFYPMLYPHLEPDYVRSLLQTAEDKRYQPTTVLRYDSIYKEPIIQYLFPVRSLGKPVGLLVIDIKEQNFRSLVERYNGFYKGHIAITDNERFVLYHTLPSLTGKVLDAQSSGSRVVNMSVPLESKNLTLRYAYEIDPKLLLYRTLAFIAVGVSVLLALVISLFLSFDITKPIVNMHRKMTRIQIGDYDARVEVQTQDEIGFLGNQFNRMAETIKQMIDHDLKLRLMNQESQIMALQAQISPHFLFNTLQMMSGIADVNRVPDLKLICQSLSNMYRYNMSLASEWVTVKEETMHVRNYLVIIGKRYTGRIYSRLEIAPEIRDYAIPKLILQPLVENAIEHGIHPSANSRGLIRISGRADKEAGILRLYVADNGNGMTDEKLAAVNELLKSNDSRGSAGKMSIGLHNVNKRIGLICGETFGVTILSRAAKGTIVICKLPLKEGG
ncbi:cache domain-containing sensor histidine kinase [Paenibacillus harenae]|uniref:cache domain-containing sensor histidine kinase n=1 Tax=Paenibacillus harenae TaxID=306543 RepID=UPI0027D8F3D8|nr:sensor histidine kinase [Paenibacillus harenae]